MNKPPATDEPQRSAAHKPRWWRFESEPALRASDYFILAVGLLIGIYLLSESLSGAEKRSSLIGHGPSYLPILLILLPLAFVFRRLAQRVASHEASVDKAERAIPTKAQRLREFLHIVILRGGIAWGGSFGLLMTLSNTFSSSHASGFWSSLQHHALIYFQAGLCWGLFMWAIVATPFSRRKQ